MIPSDLIKSVSELDIEMTRSIILLQIYTDRANKDFLSKTWSDYAEEKFKIKGIDFFQEDDGFSDFENDKSTWNKDLWETMRSEFTFNYSNVKLLRIIELMTYLRDQGHPDFQFKEVNGKNTPNNESEVLEKSNKNKKLSGSNINTSRDYYFSGGAGAILGGVSSKILGFGMPGLVAGASLGIVVGITIVYLRNNRG